MIEVVSARNLNELENAISYAIQKWGKACTFGVSEENQDINILKEGNKVLIIRRE